MAGAAVQDVIQLEFLLLVLAAPLLPGGRARVLAAAGAIATGLALAGLRAGPDEPLASLPAGFLAVESALFTGGALLGMAAAALSAAAAHASRHNVAGVTAAAVGGVGVGVSATPLVRAAAPLPFVAAAIATAALGLTLIWVGARAGRRQWFLQPFQINRRAGVAIVAGALLAASPWADPVFAGAMLAAVAGWVCIGPRGQRRLPVGPVLTLVLVPAWWLMRTIAGPEGLATVSLPDLPWSPAAERLLGALLLLGAWAMSGLWPLHREEPAALTAPVAALLMARVALPAFPDGLEHWRALVLPLVLVGAWHGVLTGNRSEALVALAWVGLATATNPGPAGAGLVLVGALLLVLAERVGRRVDVVLLPVAALAVGTGALLVTEAGLRTEVVYTVCAVAALVAAAGRWSWPQARTASALSATAPSA